MRASAHESIEATAAAWLAQRDDGLSASEAAAFEQWRQRDPRHEQAVVRLENAWRSLGLLRDFRPTAAAHPDRDLLRSKPRRQFVLRPAWVELTLAAALVLAAVWWFRPADPAAAASPRHTFATAAGGYQRSTLPDGSIVELNANTTLTAAYSKAERRVTLTQGEAHFTVARAVDRPFIVVAGALEVRALGTAFNVRLSSRQVEVLVTEGRVEVIKEDVSLAAPLVAGEQLVWSASDTAPGRAPAVRSVPIDVTRKELAWQSTRLFFTETALGEVIAQFNRHNQVQIKLADPALASLPVGGSFRPDNVEAFVRLLSSDGSIRVERPEADLIVLHPAH